MRLNTVVALLLPFLFIFLTFLVSLPDAPPSDPDLENTHRSRTSPPCFLHPLRLNHDAYILYPCRQS